MALPELSQKHGPLYEGFRMLIAEEKLNAEMIWNETKHQIDEYDRELFRILYYMQNYGTIMNQKLDKMNSRRISDEKKKCYKKYETQIARFNRDLIQQYYICKQALNGSQLKSEITDEMELIRNASFEIQQIRHICNLTDLKRMDRAEHHITVTICVVSDLAEIKQKVLEATQVIFRILARITINSAKGFPDLTDDHEQNLDVCMDFQYLRDEFETTYENIMWCIDSEK